MTDRGRSNFREWMQWISRGAIIFLLTLIYDGTKEFYQEWHTQKQTLLELKYVVEQTVIPQLKANAAAINYFEKRKVDKETLELLRKNPKQFYYNNPYFDPAKKEDDEEDQ